jgi:hypothetical protein
MYDAATGKLLASSSIYDSISDRSSMAVSDDGSVAIVQERDDTFGHSKLAAYRCTLLAMRDSCQQLLSAPHSVPVAA